MKSAQEYFQKQYEYESIFLDTDLITLILELRKKGFGCYLATDQDNLRKQYLLNELRFGEIFNDWFISSEIGFTKSQKGFWHHVLDYFSRESILLRPEEMLFIDDKLDNIMAASQFGIKCFHLRAKENLIEFNKILKNIIETTI